MRKNFGFFVFSFISSVFITQQSKCMYPLMPSKGTDMPVMKALEDLQNSPELSPIMSGSESNKAEIEMAKNALMLGIDLLNKKFPDEFVQPGDDLRTKIINNFEESSSQSDYNAKLIRHFFYILKAKVSAKLIVKRTKGLLFEKLSEDGWVSPEQIQKLSDTFSSLKESMSEILNKHNPLVIDSYQEKLNKGIELLNENLPDSSKIARLILQKEIGAGSRARINGDSNSRGLAALFDKIETIISTHESYTKTYEQQQYIDSSIIGELDKIDMLFTQLLKDL